MALANFSMLLICFSYGYVKLAKLGLDWAKKLSNLGFLAQIPILASYILYYYDRMRCQLAIIWLVWAKFPFLDRIRQKGEI